MHDKSLHGAVLIAWAKYGVRFDKHSETYEELRLYISVPEHSFHKDANGNELAGMYLARRFMTVFKEMGVKRLKVLAKIRKGEYWSATDDAAAEEAMKKALYNSQW